MAKALANKKIQMNEFSEADIINDNFRIKIEQEYLTNYPKNPNSVLINYIAKSNFAIDEEFANALSGNGYVRNPYLMLAAAYQLSENNSIITTQNIEAITGLVDSNIRLFVKKLAEHGYLIYTGRCINWCKVYKLTPKAELMLKGKTQQNFQFQNQWQVMKFFTDGAKQFQIFNQALAKLKEKPKSKVSSRLRNLEKQFEKVKTSDLDTQTKINTLNNIKTDYQNAKAEHEAYLAKFCVSNHRVTKDKKNYQILANQFFANLKVSAFQIRHFFKKFESFFRSHIVINREFVSASKVKGQVNKIFKSLRLVEIATVKAIVW